MTRHLYEPLGEGRYLPTGLTRTGWNDTDQHGGPPSALMARALEHLDLPAPMRPARISVHLLRGVPLAPLTVTTGVVRAGKRVAVADASLTTDDGAVVATARAQLIRVEPVAIPLNLSWPDQELSWPPTAHPVPPPIGDPAADGWGDTTIERFHLHAVTIRSIDAGWETPGPGAAWIHLDADLVAGETTSQLCRFVTVADMANGVASTLPYGDFQWINPDLTVALHRVPDGPWIGLEGHSLVGGDGIGVAHATAFDAHGAFGHVLQTQLVRASIR